MSEEPKPSGDRPKSDPMKKVRALLKWVWDLLTPNSTTRS